MHIRDMTDQQLKAERAKVANAPGKYAQRRWMRLLDEEIKRDPGGVDNTNCLGS